MNDTRMQRTSPAIHPAPASSAVERGEELVALFDHAELLADKVQWSVRESLHRLGDTPDSPVDTACAAIAAAIDRDHAAFDRPPYHNRQHFCEVLLTAQVLCEQNGIRGPEGKLLLLAALVHDFVHDGGTHDPFHLERASVARARPHLDIAGVDPRSQARVAALVLATEPLTGAGFAAAAHRFHQAGGPAPVPPPQAPELLELLNDTGLAAAARSLCEADVLPSVGLTLAHSLRLQRRLSAEWGRPLDRHDKVVFIDRLLANGLIGDFFLPNVLAARRDLAQPAGASRQH